jgi:hypothetical protein
LVFILGLPFSKVKEIESERPVAVLAKDKGSGIVEG